MCLSTSGLTIYEDSECKGNVIKQFNKGCHNFKGKKGSPDSSLSLKCSIGSTIEKSDNVNQQIPCGACFSADVTKGPTWIPDTLNNYLKGNFPKGIEISGFQIGGSISVGCNGDMYSYSDEKCSAGKKLFYTMPDKKNYNVNKGVPLIDFNIKSEQCGVTKNNTVMMIAIWGTLGLLLLIFIIIMIKK